MINYIAHWDRILIQSRSEIINELQEYNFRAICPINNSNKIEDYYFENINWKISKTKFFDFKAIYRLKKILDDLDENSIVHVFTLKSGFFFMIASYFSKKNFKSTLSITGLGYIFSKRLSTKLIKWFLRPIFMLLINKTFKNIVYQNSSDQNIFNKYSKFDKNSYLIESSGLPIEQYLLKQKFNKQLKVILAARLLEDKGIKEYVNLASQMSSENVKFYLAGELDKDFNTKLEQGLQKFEVAKLSAGKTTPIQETPLDFPMFKNTNVTIYELTTNYPSSVFEMAEYIANYMGLARNQVVVRKPGEPTEEYQDNMAKEKDESEFKAA